MNQRPTALSFLQATNRFAAVALDGDPAALRDARFVACIPVRDEADHIDRCLRALDRDLDADDGIVLLANDCRDETVPRVRAAMAGMRRPFLLVHASWRTGTGSAPLARASVMDLAHRLAPEAILFSTDGDTIAVPGLRAAYRAEFASDFDLVCGAIGFIESEAARLPHPELGRDETVREYRALTAQIAALVLPDPLNPLPNHGNIGGANFAITAAAYRRIGGMPTPSFGEDRALRRQCERFGLRIRYAAGPAVETSCRLVGRAEGGLAVNLARDRTENDPLVDELFEPPALLLLRLRSRRDFLRGSPAERVRLLSRLGLGEEPAGRLGEAGGPESWQRAEDLSPALSRRQLRLQELGSHLPALRRALHAIEEAPSGSAADR